MGKGGREWYWYRSALRSLNSLTFWLKEKEAEDVVYLVEYFLNMSQHVQSPAAQPLALHKLGMVTYTSNPNSGVEVGGSVIEGHPQLCSELECSLRCRRLCLKQHL